MKKPETQEFFDCLFDKDEWTCFATQKFKENRSSEVTDWIIHSTQSWVGLTINPLIKGRKRSQTNLKKLRTFLFENDTLSVQKQEELIRTSGLPYSACVFSGNKSLHYFVSLSTELTERHEYDAIWQAIKHVLQNHGYHTDLAVKDPCRFGRFPNALRHNTEKVQTLAKVNGRVSLDAIEHWLKTNGVDWTDFLPKKMENLGPVEISDASLDEKAEWIKKYFMKNQQYAKGNMYNYQYLYCRLLKRAGIRNPAEIRLIFQKDPDIRGIIDARLNIERVLSENPDDEPIYVYSKEERKRYAKELERQRVLDEADQSRAMQVLESIETDLDADSAPQKPSRETFFRDINNYIHVNNDIYRKDYDNSDNLNPVPVQKGTFKGKLGFFEDDYMALPEYDGFINWPDILDYKQEVGGKWNTFGRVVHNVEKGDWSLIERLLRHHFGPNQFDHDQYEEILEWIWVLVTKPQHLQQAIILFSKAQKTAKSAFGKLLEAIVGAANFSKIKDSELESDFNQLWVSSLIINLDEPYFQNRKKMTKVIREMVTSNKQNLRRMREDYSKVDFFAKVVITTNDTDFMEFEKNDRRYWVRESPQVAKENQDNDFENKMLKQVGHFLHYLLHERKPKWNRKQDQTFWLPQKITQTNSFAKVCGDSVSPLNSTIKTIIEDWYIKPENSKHTEVRFTTQDIIQEIKHRIETNQIIGMNIKNISDIQITKCLRDELQCQKFEKVSRLKKGQATLNPERGGSQRWWIATREKFYVDVEAELFELKM